VAEAYLPDFDRAKAFIPFAGARSCLDQLLARLAIPVFVDLAMDPFLIHARPGPALSQYFGALP